MPYVLRDELYFCMVEDRAVFMDLRRDRYFCLPEDGNSALRRLLADGDLDPAGWEALDPLVTPGLLFKSGAEGCPPIAPTIPSPPVCQIEMGDRTVAAHRLPTLLLQLAWTGLSLKRRPLVQNVRTVCRRKMRVANHKAPSRVDLGSIARTFDWTRRWLPSNDRCLLRSVAFSEHLLRRGLAVDLIFGVQLFPFTAHCWVQHRGCVLTDNLDSVRGLSQILVV